jgi:NADH-quinone oxidoreductase subunit D
MNAPATDRFVVPIGPQHPALKEPGHFEFTVEGETVVDATVRLGYAHRGIEKGAEGRNWTQSLYLLERICGICSHIHSTAYAVGVEQLAEVEVPPRAQAIREIIAELERVHSHLLWLGVAAHDAGFDTLFMYTWRDRETVMDLLETISGNRVHYSANVLGGVKFDLTDEAAAAILKGVDFLEERTHHYRKVVSEDAFFRQRTHGVGTMSREQALQLGVVGPTARASGVARDVRVDSPYVAYADFPAEIQLLTAGDLEARFLVRLDELLDSFRLIRILLAGLPAGELTAKRMPRKLKPGEVISRVEAPRGELFYYIRSTGGEQPDRVKVRTPTLCNMGSVLTQTVGHNLADVPMILVGIDPCFSCNDRAVTVRRAGRTEGQPWSWADLRRYGIDYYKRIRN